MKKTLQWKLGKLCESSNGKILRTWGPAVLDPYEFVHRILSAEAFGFSEGEFCYAEKRELGASGVDVAKALTWLEHGCAAGEHDIF